MTKQQKVNIYNLPEEHLDTLSLLDKMLTCPQAEVHLKLYDKVSLFVCQYMIREEPKPVLKKENELYRKVSHNKEGINREQFSHAFGKMKVTKPVESIHRL